MSRYTFNPPEDELISYYLNNKITDVKEPDEKQINEINICHYEPSDLPDLAKIKSSHTWYFISHVEKFGRLNRTKRTTRSGHWKITGNSRTVKNNDDNPIGLKKFLVFQENKRSSSSSSSSSVSSTITRQHHKSTWIIHEFHSFLHHPKKDDFVLCKLMKKTSPRGNAAISEDFPVALDQPLTSDLVLINPSQMLTENKNVVEDSDGNYCDILEEFHPELLTINWFDHSQYDPFDWDDIDISQSVEQCESSRFPLGESEHVYDQSTTETFHHLATSCIKPSTTKSK